MIVVGSEADQSLALVDASSLRVTRTVHLGIPVRSIVVGPDHHTVWAFSANPSETDVHLFDLASGQQTTTRLNGPPRSVAFSADGQRAFVTVGDPARVTFLGTAHQDNLGQITIGQQSPGMQLRRLADALTIARQSSSEVLYVAGRGSGLIWAIDARSGRLLQEIPIGGGPLAILADPSGQQLYAVVDTLDQLVTVDPTTGIVSSRVALPGRPTGAAIDSAGNIYITGGDAGAVWVVDRTSRLVKDTIKVGQGPAAIAVSRDGRWAYVANQRSDTLSVVDIPRRRVTASIPVGHGPTAVALAPSQPRLAAAVQPPASAIRLPTVVPMPTPSSQHPPTEHLPPGTIKETVVTGVDYPAAMAFAPDGRLFFTEVQTGQIRIVKNGVLLPAPFSTFDVAQQPETGLLGLALDPHFAQNHFVYVFYTQKAAGGLAGPNRVVRLTDVNDKGTHLTPILPNLPSGPIHDAGRLRFGPDGKLYVSIGETDHMGDSQDLGSLAGKILRINPDGSIPPDNPFVGQKGRQPAVWAYGLRNSFGFDFHPITHAMFATENGPGDNDELDLIVRGGNYGWPPSGFQDKAGLIDPIAVFNPVIAPTGLTFYRGSQIPQWTNDLFYCNYHEGQLRRIRLAPESFDRIADDEIVTPGCTLDVESGPDGALYYSDLHAIYRIRSATAPALPTVASRRAPAPSPTALPAGTRPQDRDLNVDLTEWQITLSRAKAPAGPLRLVVANLGHTAHALRIVGRGVDERTATIQPRQTIVWEITLPAGTYQVTCPIGNHAQQGMTTSLTVLPTSSAAPAPTPGAHPGTASPGPTP
jgi:YVTN family beta-propeller protein